MSISGHHFSNLDEAGNIPIPLSTKTASSYQQHGSPSRSVKSESKKSLLLKYQENVEIDADFDELSFSKFSNSGSAIVFKDVEDVESPSPYVQRLQFHSVTETKAKESHEGDSDKENHITTPLVREDHKRNHMGILQPVKLFEEPFKSTPRSKKNSSVQISLTPAQKSKSKFVEFNRSGINNFEFTSLIGNGAFASVYKAKNLVNGQIVAIKQIRLEKDQDVAVLMGEIDLLKILKHPNIVKYHGFVKDNYSLNVILEYCSKGSLRQLYKKQKVGFPEPQVIGYVREILRGLSYLHEQGVVHRDVKAANVLLTEDNQVKLADFGVASKVNSQHHTVVGTPNWMAPETILGGDGLCTASDIWSLGATIIELFTMNPPYHELNAMATLHAIGTDERPPLPKNISSLARDFLMECFQKQPNLRISANLLLKHQWLNQNSNRKKIIQKSSIPSLINIDAIDLENISTSSKPPIKTHLSKNDLLNKFQEQDEKESIILTTTNFEQLLVKKEDQQTDDTEEKDPFLELEIDNFDTNELEIQVKMEYLVVKLTRKLERIHFEDIENADSLIKVTGRMLHLIKKYPFSHDTFIRDHGTLCLVELLESQNELPKQNQLWYHTLAVLNYIFENNVGQLENFCFLGGIPIVAQFRSSAYDLRVRLEVARFINCLSTSNNALSMFVSCGGMRVVAKLLEEDFDHNATFPLVAVDTIYNILSRDVSRSKSDLCRILSKHGVLFWFAVLLKRLSKNGKNDIVSAKIMDTSIAKIVDVIKYFGQAEAKVRISISSVDLFKLLTKTFDNLIFSQQLQLLKFIKSMSCITEVLKYLYKADILEFLMKLLEQYIPTNPRYKEVINILAPVIYNCLSLNYAKEAEFVDMGAVPYLKNLSILNLPFRQFILPIMCELAYCDRSVRAKIRKYDIISLYYNLLFDPYWQSNALESLLHLYQLNPKSVKLGTPFADSCLASGFLLPKVSNFESVLDAYLQLITINEGLVKTMSQVTIVQNLLNKFKSYNQNSVIQLSLLKILKFILNHVVHDDDFQNSKLKEKIEMFELIEKALQTLKESQSSSVLIKEVAYDILRIMKT
ncbi:CDC15 [Candida pseudojiufengensis]|uniref:CDC15 n=1 Tax=Candida pseudojiufengensis TaxID=497109 RepID=UPI0022242A10|nr:CDC15 [Candida pseudojiufengensis]KAI5963264.1 CDC15 [Candida pseudojiufengensis]